MNPKRVIHFLFPLLLLVGCEKDDILFDIPSDSFSSVGSEKEDNPSDPFSSTFGVYETPIVSSNDVLKRAYSLATMEWTPVDVVPMRGGGSYDAGKTVRGAPYSSVREINTYLFQDVSYHTFMTAVHNPRSVLYTENISVLPYHGDNCASYYGVVCSSSVMYALGFSIPFSTKQIINLPFLEKLSTQVIDSLRICDLIWKTGHVQMVYDIEYEGDSISKVRLFESSGRSAHISSYSYQSFKNLWEQGNYVGLRYNNIVYSTRPETIEAFPAVNYNEDLCPSKGDRSVYRSDDIIEIDIFNSGYDEIVLMREGTIVSSEFYLGDSYHYSNLEPGVYSVFLQSKESVSDSTSFEVIEVDVGCSLSKKGDSVIIEFNSTAKADYGALCTIDGSSWYFQISEDARKKGYIVVPSWDMPEYYCKVIFQGEYGSVINKPVRVE